MFSILCGAKDVRKTSNIFNITIKFPDSRDNFRLEEIISSYCSTLNLWRRKCKKIDMTKDVFSNSSDHYAILMIISIRLSSNFPSPSNQKWSSGISWCNIMTKIPTLCQKNQTSAKSLSIISINFWKIIKLVRKNRYNQGRDDDDEYIDDNYNDSNLRN